MKKIFPTEFFTNRAHWRALTLGLVFLALLLAQLFTFEDFQEVIIAMEIPGGILVATVIMLSIPLIEIASLPYLFSMRISKRWYALVRGAAIAVPVLWFVLSVWMILRGVEGLGLGLFGATLPVLNGWWMLVFLGTMVWAVILVVRELPRRSR